MGFVYTRDALFWLVDETGGWSEYELKTAS